MLEIATKPVAAFTQRVLLDGAAYVIAIRWNERAQAWVMDLLDATEAPLLLGLILRVGLAITKPGEGGGPPGVFAAYDASGADADPAFADLGTRVRLYYAEAADLEAA